MNDSDQPISGYGVRLQRMREELSRQLAAPTASIAGTRSIVAWYLQSADAAMVRRPDLMQMLSDDAQLLQVAQSLSDEEIGAGKPAPTFNNGDAVEVIVNAKNITYHKGRVRLVQWHDKERHWHYLLEDDQGRNVSKRYIAEDLRLVAA
jgi:hypothetical protein